MKLKISELLKETQLIVKAQNDPNEPSKPSEYVPLDEDGNPMTLSDEELEQLLEGGSGDPGTPGDPNDPNDDRPSVGNLEYTYRSKNNPDRLRLLTPDGKLWDVLEMPDGHIAVQQIEVEIKFPMENFNKFKTWEEAEAALPKGWEPYMGGAINA